MDSATSVVVATWGGGGHLPPLLAVAGLLAAQGHHIRVLASAATRPAAEHAGFEVVDYRCGLDPHTDVAFERQADRVLTTIAGPEIAGDVQQQLIAIDPDLLVADCMLPAALAAANATATRAVSVVHFLYGPHRTHMVQTGDGLIDLPRLNTTRRLLGLDPLAGPVEAWEAPDLLLVTAPRWFDLEIDYPAHVVHAGPLGIRLPSTPVKGPPRERPRILISFSTTVMHGQTQLVQTVCDAVARADMEAVLTLGPAIPSESIQVPTNVVTVRFGDHDEILPGCSAVITHGGLGTTLRSLAHGIPQLIFPLGRDQHFNADRVAQLGAGMALSPDSLRAQIHASLSRLLVDDRFQVAAIKAAARITSDQPDQTAARALKSACRHR